VVGAGTLCVRAMPSLWRGPSLDLEALRSMLRLGGWITVSNMITPLLLYLDRFVIGALLSVTAVAYYATPFDLVTRMVIVPSAIASTMFPAISAATAVGSETAHILVRRGILVV